jgi:hypothetical protein
MHTGPAKDDENKKTKLGMKQKFQAFFLVGLADVYNDFE